MLAALGKSGEAAVNVVETGAHAGLVAAPEVGAEQQVVGHRHVAEQLALFGHEAETRLDAVFHIDLRLIGAGVDDAAGRRQQSHHRAEQRRLAGAVGADDGDDLTGIDGERDAAHGLRLAVGDRQIGDIEQRHHALAPR